MEIKIIITNIMGDVASRYLAEMHTTVLPPDGTQRQALKETKSFLPLVFGKWLESEYVTSADDSLGKETEIIYDLAISGRRAAGKMGAFADTIHSYLVHGILKRLYDIDGADALSKKHSELLEADAEVLTLLIHSKQAPRL